MNDERRKGERLKLLRRKGDKDLQARNDDLQAENNDLTNPQLLLRPARRVYVAILFILMCVVIGVSYMALQDKFTNIARSACQRANDVRVESNDRVSSFAEDEKNLLALLKITTETRAIEKSAWKDLNRIVLKSTPKQRLSNSIFVQYERDIHSLINAYTQAHNTDQGIQQRESSVHFDKLPIVNCDKITS